MFLNLLKWLMVEGATSLANSYNKEAESGQESSDTSKPKITITQPKPTYNPKPKKSNTPDPRQQAAYKAAAGRKERFK